MLKPWLLGCLFLLIISFTTGVQGQDVICELDFTGTVTDEHDGTPLSYANVLLVEAERSAIADVDGYFSITDLCPGTFTLRVAHLGCEPIERQLVLLKSIRMDLFLEHHSEELHDLEVIRERPDENVGQPNTELDKHTMEKSTGRSIAEVLAAVPGVTILSTGPTIGKPMIHGLSGNRILMLNQGIRQEDQQWGTEHAPNLDPFSSDRITVVKGAASVQYGSDAIGGVIITEPVDLPRTAGINGELRGVGILNGRGGGGNAMLQGGLKGLRGFGWRVQGSGKLVGDSEAPGYTLSNTGTREQGASATMGYRDLRFRSTLYFSWFQRELGILRASHIGNLTDLDNAISTGTPWYVADFTYDIDAPRQTSDHLLAKAEMDYALTERNRIVVTYAYQTDSRKEYDIRRGGRSALPALDIGLTTHTADASFKHWIGKHIHGRAGLSGLFQRNINEPGTGIRPLIPNYQKESGGVYLIEHLPLGDRLELEAGARLENTSLRIAKYDVSGTLLQPELEYTNHALGIGANWSIKDSLNVRFNISTAYRPPHVSELYSEGLHHGAAAIEVGNDQLDSERSLKGTIDIEALWFKGRLRTDLTFYTDKIGNYIYLRPAGQQLTIRGAFPVFNYVSTDALLYGLDATLQVAVTSRWSVRSRTSIVRGRDLGMDLWLFQIPSDRTETTLLYTIVKTGNWREIELGFTSNYVAQQRRIPPGLDYAPPPGSYHLMGFQASVTRKLRNNEVRIGLQASNLFNTTYRDYMDRFRYYAAARGMDVSLWVRFGFGRPR